MKMKKHMKLKLKVKVIVVRIVSVSPSHANKHHFGLIIVKFRNAWPGGSSMRDATGRTGHLGSTRATIFQWGRRGTWVLAYRNTQVLTYKVPGYLHR